MVPETVLGIPLNPITPAIYSILLGTHNAYVYGRIPREADLRNFIWFCSQYFNPDKPISSLRWRPWVMCRLIWALHRTHIDVTHKFKTTANFLKASLEINEIIESTFMDCAGVINPSSPLAASMEARMVDLFAREYRMWPLPKSIRHTPIKQLMQLARCVDRYHLGDGDVYYDRNENATTREFLEVVNRRN